MSNYIEIMENMAEAISQASKFVYQEFTDNLKKGYTEVAEKQSKILPDFVTETDKKSEEIIKAHLNKYYPDIEFIGEESGGDYNKDKFFLIDPLDGTSNFLASRKYFAICGAYIEGGEVKAAVIADPCNQIIVQAAHQKGAFYNGLKINLNNKPEIDIKQMQLECEMPIKTSADIVETSTHGQINPLEFISPIMKHVSGFRKSGSTALDILNLVLGQKSIIISSNLAPHDIAASVLIANEAGAIITDLKGNPAKYNSDAIIASLPKAHKLVSSIILPIEKILD